MTQCLRPYQLKSMLRDGKRPTKDFVVRKEMIGNITDTGERQLRYVISTSGVDRDGDTIAVDGWDLVNFRKNPVVLWAHDDQSFPIGRAIEIDVVDGVLQAVVEFVPAETPIAGPIAEAAYQLSQKGFLPATSVGFRPIEYDISNDRTTEDTWCPPLDYVRQEMLEFSLVSVPSNPDALLVTDERTSASEQSAEIDQMRAHSDAVEKAQRARRARIKAARRALAGAH